jgi:hypothetical protein
MTSSTLYDDIMAIISTKASSIELKEMETWLHIITCNKGQSCQRCGNPYTLFTGEGTSGKSPITRIGSLLADEDELSQKFDAQVLKSTYFSQSHDK